MRERSRTCYVQPLNLPPEVCGKGPTFRRRVCWTGGPSQRPGEGSWRYDLSPGWPIVWFLFWVRGGSMSRSFMFLRAERRRRWVLEIVF